MPRQIRRSICAVRAIISGFFFNSNTALISRVQAPRMDATLSKSPAISRKHGIFVPRLARLISRLRGETLAKAKHGAKRVACEGCKVSSERSRILKSCRCTERTRIAAPLPEISQRSPTLLMPFAFLDRIVSPSGITGNDNADDKGTSAG